MRNSRSALRWSSPRALTNSPGRPGWREVRRGAAAVEAGLLERASASPTAASPAGCWPSSGAAKGRRAGRARRPRRPSPQRGPNGLERNTGDAREPSHHEAPTTTPSRSAVPVGSAMAPRRSIAPADRRDADRGRRAGRSEGSQPLADPGHRGAPDSGSNPGRAARRPHRGDGGRERLPCSASMRHPPARVGGDEEPPDRAPPRPGCACPRPRLRR